MAKPECDQCMYLEYDEEYMEQVCVMNMDEDELARMAMGRSKRCPYFRFGDEYSIVKKQI